MKASVGREEHAQFSGTTQVQPPLEQAAHSFSAAISLPWHLPHNDTIAGCCVSGNLPSMAPRVVCKNSSASPVLQPVLLLVAEKLIKPMLNRTLAITE